LLLLVAGSDLPTPIIVAVVTNADADAMAMADPILLYLVGVGRCAVVNLNLVHCKGMTNVALAPALL